MANEQSKATPAAPELPPIQLNQDLITAIAAAVALALKQSNGPQFSMEELGNTIGKSVAAGIASTTRRKVTIGEYIKTGHSPFHPHPLAETPRFLSHRRYYQNGVAIQHTTCTDKEVELLNKIDHGGRYVNRLVEVQYRDEGSDVAIDIRFKNATPDLQLELKGHCKNFEDMLEQIAAAQDEERKEAEFNEADRQERRRKFGDTKAMREAQAKRAAVEAEA
jgi:hypothetical protein